MATVRWLHAHRGIYQTMEDAGARIGEAAAQKSEGSFVRLGSMFKYFFRDRPPRTYQEAKECNTGKFAVFWNAMRKEGIFLPPSQFETNFLSAVHEDDDISRIVSAYQACL
jgi:glutamate-1-semialdehyde 2,1-aminomutase